MYLVSFMFILYFHKYFGAKWRGRIAGRRTPGDAPWLIADDRDVIVDVEVFGHFCDVVDRQVITQEEFVRVVRA